MVNSAKGSDSRIEYFSCTPNDLRTSCTTQQLMKTNTYLKGRNEGYATLFYHLTYFHTFTNQEFVFEANTSLYVTCMDRSPASSLFFAIRARVMLCYCYYDTKLMEDIYEMGHSCLVGMLFNAELTVPSVRSRGILGIKRIKLDCAIEQDKIAKPDFSREIPDFSPFFFVGNLGFRV
jgi:hypothetical protein